MRSAGRWEAAPTMRRVLRPPEPVQKQLDDAALAEAFLARKPLRPGPEWYAELLEEHAEEIAVVLALWLANLQERLFAVSVDAWFDAQLWYELERALAISMAPTLRRAAVAAMRRQAVEAGEPVAVQAGDLELAAWAGTEAARQAVLIAEQTREGLVETARAAEAAGMDDGETRFFALETGLFGLNRRFAQAATRRALDEGMTRDERFAAAKEHGERLLAVRGEGITQGTAVDAVHAGLAMAALLWQQAGRTVTKTWIAVQDELLCPICGSLHMQTVRRDQSFTAANGSMYEKPKAHLYCRCFVAYRIIDNGEGGLSGLPL